MTTRSRLAWCSAIIAASMQTVDAKLVSGKEDATTKTFIFNNIDTATPIAKKTDGTTTSTDLFKWEVSNLSWIDEDTGDQYIEITNTLTAPILKTDVIMFHMEFTSSQQATLSPTSQLVRDVATCQLTKDVTTDFWTTVVNDQHIRQITRPTAADALVNETVDDNPRDDNQPTKDREGKNWFVFQQDAELDENNLCLTSATTGIQCDQIRCVMRRKMKTDDDDDMWFVPDGSGNNQVKMLFPKSKSYLQINQGTYQAKQVLHTLKDTEIVILQGAFNSLVASTGLVLASLAALTAF